MSFEGRMCPGYKEQRIWAKLQFQLLGQIKIQKPGGSQIFSLDMMSFMVSDSAFRCPPRTFAIVILNEQWTLDGSQVQQQLLSLLNVLFVGVLLSFCIFRHLTSKSRASGRFCLSHAVPFVSPLRASGGFPCPILCLSFLSTLHFSCWLIMDYDE